MEDVTKELEHRRRILSIYNKSRNEFDTKDDYDNYLEAVEDIIYKLTYNIDVAEVEQQVQDYIRQEAATAGAHGTSDGPASYAPTTAMGAPLQPTPLVPVQQDQDGRLMPINPGQTFTRDKWRLMGQASGWAEDMATQRALQDAFSTIILF